MSTLKVDTYLTRGGASEIAIDKLKGVTAAGSMLVVGEGGTNTTNLQQGLAKAWVSYEQDDNDSPGNTIHGSFNVASQTDSATGKTITNFSNNFANAGYSFAGQLFDGGGYNDARTLNHDRNNDQYTTAGLGYYNWNGSALDDAFRYFGQFMGDLA